MARTKAPKGFPPGSGHFGRQVRRPFQVSPGPKRQHLVDQTPTLGGQKGITRQGEGHESRCEEVAKIG